MNVTTPAGTSTDHSADRFNYELGPVRAWGDGVDGALGDDGIASLDVPVEVSGSSEVVALAAGESHSSLALLGNGTVVAWGYNGYGALGDGTHTSSEAPVGVCAAGVQECPDGPYLYARFRPSRWATGTAWRC